MTGPNPTGAGVAAAKRSVRAEVQRRRSERSAGQRQTDDQRRTLRCQEQLVDRPPHRLAAYLSAGVEPDSLRLVAWAVARKIEVLLPVLTDGQGRWLPTPAWASYEGPDLLRIGRAGILEPTGAVLPGDPLAGVELMIVPGLAADRSGNRLGRGGGWYDRARADHTDLETWLLLNDDEVLDVVPTDAWDLPVQLLITPDAVISSGSEPAS